MAERSRQGGKRQQAEVAFSALKRVFGIDRTLAKTSVGRPSGPWRRLLPIHYGYYVNRLRGRRHGRIEESEA